MPDAAVSHVRVGLLQLPGDEPYQASCRRAEVAVAEAVAAGAAIVVLPEFTPRRWFAGEPGRLEDLVPPPGAVAAWAAELARRHRCHLHCTDIEAGAGRRYNTARLHGPSGCALMHRKRHLPDEPGFRETSWYSPGTAAPATGEAAGARIGALTCSDAMFPEEARGLGRLGCEVILVPRATPAEPASMRRWSVMLRADAIVSGAYVISVNRVGREGPVEFAGRSMVVAPDGEVIAELGPAPALKIVDLDLAAARAAKAEYPVLAGRDDWVQGGPAAGAEPQAG
ncbi:MAG TPA: carbon-nitrogen hydrolase family protein [Candidatus Binatia bacterium]|nr:carbon-nitrogen hydrolase family protein [Candidatus Binatia bacterium]